MVMGWMTDQYDEWDAHILPTGKYWMQKSGKEPTPDDVRSLRVLCKKYPHQIVGGAIGQAVIQGERPDNFALITTICKADSGGAK